MAAFTDVNGAVRAGNGLGPKTFIFSVDTAELTVAAAVTLATTTYGMTVAAVEGTADGSHIACQGANLNAAADASLEDTTGIALVATFDQNPA